VYGVLLERAVTAEVSGVCPKYSFIEIFQGRSSVDIIWYDTRPLAPTTITGSPLTEPFEFAGCISSIVPTVPTAAFPLVLEIAFERFADGNDSCSA
jgi:hypothetical protein